MSTELLLPVQVKLSLGLSEIREDIAKVAQQNVDIDIRQRRNDEAYQTLAGYIYKEFGALLKDVHNQLGHYRQELDASRVDQQAMLTAVQEAGVRLQRFEDGLAAINGRLETGEHERAAIAEKLDRYIAGSRRAEVDDLQRQVRELRGPEMPPEQRARYVAILMRMIAEWEAAHPDDIP